MLSRVQVILDLNLLLRCAVPHFLVGEKISMFPTSVLSCKDLCPCQVIHVYISIKLPDLGGKKNAYTKWIKKYFTKSITSKMVTFSFKSIQVLNIEGMKTFLFSKNPEVC